MKFLFTDDDDTTLIADKTGDVYRWVLWKCHMSYSNSNNQKFEILTDYVIFDWILW